MKRNQLRAEEKSYDVHDHKEEAENRKQKLHGFLTEAVQSAEMEKQQRDSQKDDWKQRMEIESLLKIMLYEKSRKCAGHAAARAGNSPEKIKGTMVQCHHLHSQ